MNKMALRIGRTLLALVIIGGLALSSTGGTPSRAQDASSVPAPRVVFSSPAQREVAGPDVSLQFAFDQPMNQASVEAAFQIEPLVNGSLTWPDESTLVFDPTGPLERGMQYRVTIDSSAQSAEGVAMDDDFRLDFEIAPNLSVNQVIPAPGAENVEAGATITVVFDRPVVPLVVTGAQSDLPQPLTLSPEVEGTGEWVGTAIYVFRPARALAGSTLYTATVSGDLTDVDGSPMDAPYTWQFRTMPPQILSTEPYSNASQVALEQVIKLYFNQPMDPDSTRAAFTLRNANTGADVAGALSFENEG
ncbi:MAG: Ig-like domain-containing protein, partial [Anaerolineae bacterium]|nr:Ig-like domain-containing protein [Anaerolineae bacterium]